MRRFTCLRGFLAALVLLLILPSAGYALKAGDDALVTADIRFQKVPYCALRISRDLCAAGYDDGSTPADVGDDTVYLYQATEEIRVVANTAPLKPTGLDDVLPRMVSADTRRMVFEQPVFLLAERVGGLVGSSIPGPARPFLDYSQSSNRTLFVWTLPVGRLLGIGALPPYLQGGIPIIYNWFGLTNRTHAMPLSDSMVRLLQSDEFIDGPIYVFGLREGCGRPFQVPVQDVLPGPCSAVAMSVDSASTQGKALLPNIVCCADTTGGEVFFKPDGGQSGAGLGLELQKPRPLPAAEVGRGFDRVGAMDETRAPVFAEAFSASTQAGSRSGATRAAPPAGGSVPSALSAGEPLVVVAVMAFLALLLWLYSRIGRDRLLDHDNRRRIHELVLANPGITVGEVSRRIGLSYKTVQRHVERLLNAGILAHRGAGRRRLFENHGVYSPRAKSLIAELRTPVARQIIEGIAMRPGITQTELARELRLSLSTVNFYAARLLKLGCLVGARRGHEVGLAVTSEWRAATWGYLYRASDHSVPVTLGTSS